MPSEVMNALNANLGNDTSSESSTPHTPTSNEIDRDSEEGIRADFDAYLANKNPHGSVIRELQNNLRAADADEDVGEERSEAASSAPPQRTPISDEQIAKWAGDPRFAQEDTFTQLGRQVHVEAAVNAVLEAAEEHEIYGADDPGFAGLASEVLRLPEGQAILDALREYFVYEDDDESAKAWDEALGSIEAAETLLKQAQEIEAGVQRYSELQSRQFEVATDAASEWCNACTALLRRQGLEDADAIVFAVASNMEEQGEGWGAALDYIAQNPAEAEKVIEAYETLLLENVLATGEWVAREREAEIKQRMGFDQESLGKQGLLGQFNDEQTQINRRLLEALEGPKDLLTPEERERIRKSAPGLRARIYKGEFKEQRGSIKDEFEAKDPLRESIRAVVEAAGDKAYRERMAREKLARQNRILA